ncbi:MAG: Flp pilus assembly protein CpaB [Phenylobacterium sp.]|uniref:Flp pilus assembly protein CpaB n=1 Tax=Phenylobacterium sp. TaxID=1871053 RepID=UPI0025F119D2|nr:Flp pilus assembly protein CpaB [Phenylobacterium sp.]MBA4010516.1 Flp pilus assembly protein CpaB [Phenylobacterium sp.]
MSLRTLASFALAILLGLIAVLVVRGVMTSQRPAAAQMAAMTPVVVAMMPIERGVELKPAMLKTVNYPSDAVPAGSFRSADLLVGKDTPARITVRSMIANEPVLAAKLSGGDGKTNLSGTLTPGMRAVSVRSTDVTGVGGFVLPGDHVDILLTRTVSRGESETTITQVLAENSLVLGVDQMSDQDADKPQVAKAVTIEVTPDQAQAVSLGLSVGEVSLSLRQSADVAALTKKVTSVADLAGPGARKPAPVKRAPVRRSDAGMTEVRVTRGVETAGYSVRAF